MKIAIIGTRGIPASYGGFETMAEELSIRLVKRGHDVTVYGRANAIDYEAEYYRGVKIKILPTISHKYLDTVCHTFLSVLHTVSCPYDVILICNAANSIFSLLPRALGKKVAVNVDGIERLRKKWNWLGRLWYLLGEVFAVALPNKIVTDARVIRDYYKERYNKDSIFIPYGARTERVDSRDTLDRLGLIPHEYILYVSRLEPENNAHIVIRAFEGVKTDRKLVIVGDAPYSKKYIANLKRTTDNRIIFAGYVFGRGYRELQSHAYCYIHATEVGGTHPALIEAMGFGNCVIANATPENLEVLQHAGLIYKKNSARDLRAKIQFILDNPQAIVDYGMQARRIVMTEYNWDEVTDKYENLFMEMLQQKK